MESPPPGLTSAFSFSLKEEEEKKDQEEEEGKKKNPNPNTSEHFGTKKWYLQEMTFYL